MSRRQSADEPRYYLSATVPSPTSPTRILNSWALQSCRPEDAARFWFEWVGMGENRDRLMSEDEIAEIIVGWRGKGCRHWTRALVRAGRRAGRLLP